MITSITLREHPYVLENDRAVPKEEQTVFYIKPKTVRGTTETAAAYARTQKQNRKKGTTEIDVGAMFTADDDEWLRAVMCVKNFAVLTDAPQKAYDHFKVQAREAVQEGATPLGKYRVEADRIVVVETRDPEDLKYIFWSMSPDHTEEIMTVYFDYSKLTAQEKNA